MERTGALSLTACGPILVVTLLPLCATVRASLEVRAGLVNEEFTESTAIPDEPATDEPSRTDVSIGSVVDACPSREALGQRAAMVALFAEQAAAAVAAGDLEAARIAHEAMGRLLASATVAPAGVVDLAVERARRGG